jgi:hypothetical protein
LWNQGRCIATADSGDWQGQIGSTGGKKSLQETVCNALLIEVRHVLMYS